MFCRSRNNHLVLSPWPGLRSINSSFFPALLCGSRHARRARARGMLVAGLSGVGPCDSDWSISMRFGSKTLSHVFLSGILGNSLHLIMWNMGHDRSSQPSAWRRKPSYWTCRVFSFGCCCCANRIICWERWFVQINASGDSWPWWLWCRSGHLRLCGRRRVACRCYCQCHLRVLKYRVMEGRKLPKMLPIPNSHPTSTIHMDHILVILSYFYQNACSLPSPRLPIRFWR